MTSRVVIFLCLLCSFSKLHSQNDNIQILNQAKQEIDLLFEEENYAAAWPKIQKQILFIKEHQLYDSLYAYAYPAGRTLWKVKTAKDGARFTEEIISDIAQKDKDYHHLLTALTDLSWLYYETGNDSMCLKTDERYTEECKRIKDIEADLLARGYYNLGFDYLAIGNAITANDYFGKAIDVIKNDTSNHDALLLKLYNAQGSSQYRLGNFKAAIESYNASLMLGQRNEDVLDKNSNMANTYGNLSLIYKDQCDFVKSKEMLEKSLYHRSIAMNAAVEPHLIQQEQDNLVKGYTNLASIYLKIGEFDITEKLLNKAKIEREKMLEASDPRVNMFNESFGSLYLAQGKNAEALACFERYKSGCIKHYGELSFWTGIAAHDVGKAQHAMKNDTEAKQNFTEAIRIFKAIGDDENNQDLASSFLDRSDVNIDMHLYDEALMDVEMARAIYAQTRDSTDGVFANCLLLEADILVQKNELNAAREKLAGAIAVLESVGLSKTEQAEQVRYLNPYLPSAYRKMASLEAKMFSDASSLKSAMHYLDLAVKSVSSAEITLSGNNAILDLYAENEALFDDGLELSHRLFLLTGDDAYALKMLQLAEQSKTLMLRKRLNDFTSIVFSKIPDSLVIQEHELARELSELTIESPEQVLKMESEFHACIQSLKDNFPQYYQLKYKTEVARIDEIQSTLLHEGQNFLEYFLTDSNAFALIVCPEEYHLVKLPRTETMDMIRAYNDAIRVRNDAMIADLSYSLYVLLFQPIENFLRGNEIIVVPDNQLFQINFETLRNKKNGDVNSSLIFKYTISYMLSATTGLQFNLLKKSSSNGVLALAPGFSDELKAEYTGRNFGHDFFRQRFLTYIQQPFTLKTAQNITSILSGVSLTANNATESNFRSNAGKYGVIHFGTHTEINNTSPLMSRLILCASPTDSTDAGDGFLHAYEIYDLELKAELAVLSACETGYGQPNSSEGILSLAHSFAYAGCPSVVMSSWQIDEKTTSEIIEEFYRQLSKGVSKNEALRNAKLLFIQNHPGELSSPYYWAGLVLIGDVEPLSGAGWFAKYGIVTGIAVFFLLAITFLIMRRRYRAKSA